MLKTVSILMLVAFIGCKEESGAIPSSSPRMRTQIPAEIPIFKVNGEGGEAHIKINTGDKFIIEEFSLTGWEWSLKSTIPDCLTLVSENYIHRGNTDPMACGNGLTRHYLFLARTECSEKIEFEADGYGKMYYMSFQVVVDSP